MSQIAINDVGTEEDFLRAIDDSMRQFSYGQVVSGVVVQIDREGVLLDIGYKTEGFIPRKEVLSSKDEDINDVIKIGEHLEATIVHIDPEGNYTLSLKEGKVKRMWDMYQNKYEISEPVIGKVKKAVKGGLIVDIGVQAFLPGSLIDLNRVDNFEAYVGQEVEAIILQFDRAKQNIVLSRKELLKKTADEDKQIQFAKLSVGQIHDGKIAGMSNYGVFVKIGLISGLIHKSKMGGYVPENFVVGQDVKVEILDIDFEKSRLSLQHKG